MGGLAPEGHGGTAASHPGHFRDVIAKGMNHNGHIHPVQGTTADEIFLSGMALLSGGSQQNNSPRHWAGLEFLAQG